MDSTERLNRLLAGEKPDRPPVSFWRHFYDIEHDPDRFAESMIHWQKTYDWDFLKINPKASWHVEPWGVKMLYSTDAVTKPSVREYPIKSLADWDTIEPLPPTHPEFDAQLRAIRQIRNALPLPFRMVMTLFDPISIAGDLIEDDREMVRHLREHPETIRRALQAIQTTLTALVPEFLDAGADGIFFATTQWASSDLLTIDEFHDFGRAYSDPVWEASIVHGGKYGFNILHVCDSNNYLADYVGLQSSIVNWDASDPTNRSLADGYNLLHVPVMGGFTQKDDLPNGVPDQLAAKTQQLVTENADIPYVMGAGCAISVTTPDANLQAIRAAVDGAGGG